MIDLRIREMEKSGASPPNFAEEEAQGVYITPLLHVSNVATSATTSFLYILLNINTNLLGLSIITSISSPLKRSSRFDSISAILRHWIAHSPDGPAPKPQVYPTHPRALLVKHTASSVELSLRYASGRFYGFRMTNSTEVEIKSMCGSTSAYSIAPLGDLSTSSVHELSSSTNSSAANGIEIRGKREINDRKEADLEEGSEVAEEEVEVAIEEEEAVSMEEDQEEAVIVGDKEVLVDKKSTIEQERAAAENEVITSQELVAVEEEKQGATMENGIFDITSYSPNWVFTRTPTRPPAPFNSKFSASSPSTPSFYGCRDPETPQNYRKTPVSWSPL